MYNWTSNQTVLILKTEWVVCTIGVPYKQYFAKMIKFNGLYFLYWSSKIKIQLLCTSVIYVQLMCKKTTFYLENCRKINRATVTSRSGISCSWALPERPERLRLVGGYIHAKGATFWHPPTIFNHFNNQIFLLENPVIIRINRCLTYSTILKIVL